MAVTLAAVLVIAQLLSSVGGDVRDSHNEPLRPPPGLGL
jgi:hypothetical protein